MAEERLCLACNQPISRKLTAKGKLEPLFAQRRRSYCNRTCAVNARVGKPRGVTTATSYEDLVPFPEMARQEWR